MPRYGFQAAPGTDYTRGVEPQIASRIDRMGKALHRLFIGISGYRTPQHSVAVGGFRDDPHTQAGASDTQGAQNVPESTLERYGLTRPFPGAAEADHLQLLGWKGGTTTRRVRGRTSGPADWLKQGGWPNNLIPIMVGIGGAESGWRVDAVSPPNTDGTVDLGWLQINSVHIDSMHLDRNRLLTDPVYTSRVGYQIFKTQGLHAWSTYTSGAYKAFIGGANHAPTFGRTRPGGGGQDNPDADISAVFADYIAAGNPPDPGTGQNVGFGLKDFAHPFDPLKDAFTGPLSAIKDVGSFLKWIAWIFHPRNILRAVEFLTGATLMGFGIHTAIETHREGGTNAGTIKRTAGRIVNLTPQGRELKAVRAGRGAARREHRASETSQAHRTARAKERARLKTKSNERETTRRYGRDVPF